MTVMRGENKEGQYIEATLLGGLYAMAYELNGCIFCPTYGESDTGLIRKHMQYLGFQYKDTREEPDNYKDIECVIKNKALNAWFR